MSHDDMAATWFVKADVLCEGDMVFTPAQRWETVVRVDAPDDSSIDLRIFTDLTGEAYSWRWRTFDKVRRVPNWELNEKVAVRVHDWSYRRRGHITASVSPYLRDYDTKTILVTAQYNGPGQGWSVIDHPAGGPASITVAESKPKALSFLNRAAKAHAKALRLPFLGLTKTTGGGS